LNLEDRIWKTRKARINMSERLKHYDFYSQMLIIYYSLLLIIVTIIDINNKNIDVSIPTLIFSIIILVMSVFVYAMSFGKRSVEIQKTYTSMQRILSKIKRLSNTNRIEDEYYDLLESSENHRPCDFLKVLYEVKNQKDNDKLNGKFTWDKSLKYFFCFIKTWFIIIILFLLPLIWCMDFFKICFVSQVG